MVDSAARVVRIRTTQDDSGGACGIVTGMGATPQLALDELRHEAEGLARQAGREANEVFEKAGPGGLGAASKEKARKAAGKTGAWKPERRSAETSGLVHGPPEGARRRMAGPPGVVPSWSRPREWRFEVVDVRLTPGLMEGGGSGWLAYGTLAWERGPRQASTTDAGSGSYGGSRDDRRDRGNPGGRETRS
jgi:hypothetical protein